MKRKSHKKVAVKCQLGQLHTKIITKVMSGLTQCKRARRNCVGMQALQTVKL